MPFTPPVDGPPPSPATDPAAAREVGQPIPASQLAAPMQIQPQGPDLSGILQLGHQIDQGLLSLASAVPTIADGIGRIRGQLDALMGQFASTAGQSNGSMPAAQPRGQVISQSGNQWPAGGQQAGRPF